MYLSTKKLKFRGLNIEVIYTQTIKLFWKSVKILYSIKNTWHLFIIKPPTKRKMSQISTPSKKIFNDIFTTFNDRFCSISLYE